MLMDFCLIFVPFGYFDEPDILRYANTSICPTGADVTHVTVNLVALRRLEGDNGQALRRYILGLSLIAAIEPLDAFLRQGCLLVPDTATAPVWMLVGRNGERSEVALAEGLVLDYASTAAGVFGVGDDRYVNFDKTRAKEDVKKADKVKKTDKKAQAS